MNEESNKKIAVISSHTSSLFCFRIDMMKNFIAQGYQVLAVGQASEQEWQDKFMQHGIQYRQVFVERNGMNPLNDLKTLRELKRLLKEEQPQKIFCYQAKTIIYTCLAAKKNKIKEVYTLIAGLGSGFRNNSFKGKLIRLVMTLEYKKSLKYSNRIMFQNEDDMSVFLKKKIVKSDKCFIINGSGVDIGKFAVVPFPKTPTFLMISRLIKDKGLIEYLKACEMVKQQFPTVRCLLVGPFDSNPSAIQPTELRTYIDKGVVEYFGEQEDVRPYIAQASVFVLPSYHEGTPKTVLENMACGRAIITTDAPGCRETVKDGKNGWLVPIKNVDAIVEKMTDFILNPNRAEEMGKKGRILVEEKYDVNKVNQSINSIMNL